MRRWIIALLLPLVILACTGERPAPTAASAKDADDGRPRSGGTLIRRLDVDVVTLNPVIATSRYDRLVDNYLFTPLIYLDKNLHPIPALAESWDVADDGLTYTFHLNPKATFSDGTPVTARDVLFTLKKIVDPHSESVQMAGAFELLDQAKSRVADDHTLHVVFRAPLASQLIRFNEVLVLPEKVYAKGDFKRDFNDTPVGSGPYRLVKLERGKELVLERRKDYWGEQPYIDRVVFKVINDHTTAANALKRGDIDETFLPTDVWLRDRVRTDLQKKIEFLRFYTLNYNCIAWNNRHPILSDKRVRRAIAMAMPLDSVVNDLYQGTARAMSGPFTPDDWAYNPRVPVIRHDPEGAKRLLASDSWLDQDGDGVLEKKGKPLEIELIVMSGGGTTMQFAQLLQAELKAIGVRLDIAVLEGSVAIDRMLQGNYESILFAWDLDPDPDPFAVFHSSQMPPRGQNFVYYSNPEADRLIDQGRRELDHSKRVDIYQRLHEVLAEDQPYAWTVQVSSKWGVNKRVRGVEVSPKYGLFLWYPGDLGWWIAADPQAGAGPAAR
ncbi:MAG: ABC transporter substrate-binding protein [Thermoanaerobaculia bacterium]